MAHGSTNPTWTNSSTTPINATALENVEGGIDRLYVALFGGVGRTRRATARIWYTNPGYTQGAVDLFAQGGWTAAIDTENGYVAGNTGTGVPSQYVIPLANRLWDIHYSFHCSALPSGASLAAKVLLNGASITNPSNVFMAGETVGNGGEGHCFTSRQALALNQGDILRWSAWASSNVTCGTVFGHPCEIIIRDAGPAPGS